MPSSTRWSVGWVGSAETGQANTEEGRMDTIILANAVAVFLEEGLHWTLPGAHDRYRLLDLGRPRHVP